VKAFNALSLVLWGQLAVAVQALQISTRTEEAAISRNDHAANVGAGLGHTQRLNTCSIHLWPKRVSVLWVTQSENERCTFAGTEQLGWHDSVLGVQQR
jgi:hypothetical protein